MVPRWPRDKDGYRAGGEAAGSSQQLLREKGAQIRKTPGKGPAGAPEAGNDEGWGSVGGQAMRTPPCLRRSTEPNTLSPDTLPDR